MLVLDWGMNVYKMVKFTPVDRRLFVSCIDFLLNYVARKLSFNYEKKNLYYKCFVGYFENSKKKNARTPHVLDIAEIYLIIISLCFTFAEPFGDIFLFVKLS